ncbi:aldehyde dehydrogenase family protein [Burkholderia multivorans]|uniref:aldehyde dehydrogenase family protein n=1 Tax=Burkholderia multivorans TaxID=87883 RepID=UPI0000E941B9|nr:aldehyde dehydrogenase family protein [Burkholderia multivorans]AYY99495.1 aldehyde dehydrogenase family protein [Burkholderia multivorans]MBJ9616652.1 aldehyde dehydrogenase family protein [Burkholderia multivorans]MCA8462621.1 aldehyde dehydrogenase family protein [Burkholderia multivorans]QGR92000.1 aldehyde dehydrogenase family protein [Burkholderia multivorans]
MLGPFVTVTTFRTGEEALAIANGTACRFGAGLCTRDLQRTRLRTQFQKRCRANRVRQTRERLVAVRRRRCERTTGARSGYDTMHEYAHAKSVRLDVDAQIPPYYPR